MHFDPEWDVVDPGGRPDLDPFTDERLDFSSPELPEVLIVDDLPDGPVVAEQGRIPATIASAVLHLWLIFTLASMTMVKPEPLYEPPLDARIITPQPVEEPDQVIEYELANPNDRDHEQHVALNARSVGQSQSQEMRVESAPLRVLDDLSPQPVRALYDIPEGVEIDDRIVVQGTAGEGLIQIEAALDRVTWEIANNLKERKCLVVWLLDASGSLLEQRRIIARRLTRVYGELDALENAGEIPRLEQPLLSAVVTFGAKTTYITPEPTDEVAAIVDAVGDAPTDPSGLENVFGAVEQILKKWGHYRTRHGRRILVITVTDEAGDDFGEHLEPSIALANRLGARAYVIGPPAAFGRREGYVPYVAPEDGQTYQLPVDIGPETAVAENVQLPFWFGEPQHEYISAGMGPYALTRLVKETGGVYFMTTTTTSTGLAPTGNYDPIALQPFQPDYRFGRPEDYYRDLGRHPLRRAVVEAAALSTKYKVQGTPQLVLRVTPQNYMQTLSTAQQTVAISTQMLDNILRPFEGITEADYEREQSPRWRAAYNLSYGRLLAQKIRCYEYNFACAAFKQKGADEVATRSNHWIFRPAPELNYAVSLKRYARQAEMLLQRVIDEAPGTPWAVLAARELRDPLGLKIIERYDPPPTPAPPGQTPPPSRKKRIQLANENRPQPQTPQAPRPKPVLPKL